MNAPPNHHLFNALSNNHLGQVSPLLECRLRNAAPPAPATPVFNFNVPPDLITLFREPAHQPNQPQSGTSNSSFAPMLSPMLLPSGRISGPDLSLSDFCIQYGITDSVKIKLEENGYVGSHTFQYAELQELKDAGL